MNYLSAVSGHTPPIAKVIYVYAQL